MIVKIVGSTLKVRDAAGMPKVLEMDSIVDTDCVEDGVAAHLISLAEAGCKYLAIVEEAEPFAGEGPTIDETSEGDEDTPSEENSQEEPQEATGTTSPAKPPVLLKRRT